MFNSEDLMLIMSNTDYSISPILEHYGFPVKGTSTEERVINKIKTVCQVCYTESQQICNHAQQ